MYMFMGRVWCMYVLVCLCVLVGYHRQSKHFTVAVYTQGAPRAPVCPYFTVWSTARRVFDWG
jgi:hypothetical protein